MWQSPQLEILKNYKKVSAIDNKESNLEVFEQTALDEKFYEYLNKALFSSAGNYFSMYEHQASSMKLADSGKNIVLTTGTGSGKTEGMYLNNAGILMKPSSGSRKRTFNKKNGSIIKN